MASRPALSNDGAFFLQLYQSYPHARLDLAEVAEGVFSWYNYGIPVVCRWSLKTAFLNRLGQKAKGGFVKKLLVSLVFVSAFLPSLAFAQNCGQGQTHKQYLFMVIGMDEGQGGSQVTEEAQVINGYDFQYKLANLSDQRCGIELGFRFVGQDGKITTLKWWGKIEPSPDVAFKTIDGYDVSFFSLGTDIRPFNRLTETITVAPSFPGLFTGWAEVRQDGNYERIVSLGTIRLYQNGEVISQFSMKPVEAKLVNYVQVFAAERDSQRTGIAVGNPYSEELNVNIQIFNRFGIEICQQEQKLEKYGNFSRFINELCFIENDLEWQMGQAFNGLIKITSTKEVPVTAIDGRVSQGKFLMSIVGAN